MSPKGVVGGGQSLGDMSPKKLIFFIDTLPTELDFFIIQCCYYSCVFPCKCLPSFNVFV